MTLSDLASLGSFVSGLAVLVSLVFLYFQLKQVIAQAKQAEKNQRALMQQGRSARVVEHLWRQLEPHMQETLNRGRRGDLTLEPVQIDAFLRVAYAGFLNFEDTFIQHQQGTIDPSAWVTSVARLKSVFSLPGYRAAWERWRGNFGSEFAATVDRIIAEARHAPAVDLVAMWKADVSAEQATAST